MDQRAEFLAWMKKNKVPLTLEAAVDLNWGGSKTVDEVLDSPELLAQVPEELLPKDEEPAPDSQESDVSDKKSAAKSPAEPDEDATATDQAGADTDADADAGEDAGYQGAEEQPEAAPSGPSMVMERGKSYTVQYHDEKTGVAVKITGKLRTFGKDGATLVTDDGHEHKVPWSAFAKPGEKPRAKVQASSAPVAKAAAPVLLFRKSEDAGGVPLMILGMAVAAQQDAAVLSAAPAPGPVEDPGPAQDAVEPYRDGRVGYLRHAFSALRNFWKA